MTKGKVSSLLIAYTGSGYSTSTQVPTQRDTNPNINPDSTGEGAVLSVSATDGVVDSIVAIDDPGDGYMVGDYLLLNGGEYNCWLLVNEITE